MSACLPSPLPSLLLAGSSSSVPSPCPPPPPCPLLLGPGSFASYHVQPLPLFSSGQGRGEQACSPSSPAPVPLMLHTGSRAGSGGRPAQLAWPPHRHGGTLQHHLLSKSSWSSLIGCFSQPTRAQIKTKTFMYIEWNNIWRIFLIHNLSWVSMGSIKILYSVYGHNFS